MTSKYREYPDPMEKRLDPDRVNYANGVLLDENDFRDEQTYFRGRLGRALTYLHGMGTVAGLNVMQKDVERREAENLKRERVIRVEPGLAIDRIGRLIELSVPYCIRAQKWFDAQDSDQLSESFANSSVGEEPKAVVADVYIGFNNCGRGNTPYFGVGNVDATDAFTADRLRDGACLQLILRPDMTSGAATQKPPHQQLIKELEDEKKAAEARAEAGEEAVPLPTFEERMERIRKFKIESGWSESNFWNKDADNINKIHVPEYTSEQNGTEIFLARVRLPAAIDPNNNDLLKYDTQGAINITDDPKRLLSYSTFELSWLIQATEK